MDTTKLEKFFKLSAFQITFLQLNTKKILLYVIGQDFLNYYFLQLEFSIARSTWERYHITNIGHTGNKQTTTDEEIKEWVKRLSDMGPDIIVVTSVPDKEKDKDIIR